MSVTYPFHDYAFNPCGPHPTELDMEHLVDHAVSRLVGLGASKDQAEQMVAAGGTDFVRAESDGMLKQKIADLTEDIPGYSPDDYHVDEVVSYATEHPDEVAAIIEAEQAGKARKTLLAQLEELSTSADGTGGESEPDAGVEGKTDGDDADSD